MKSRVILITGTDTGVGKTFVASGIAAALRGRGLRVGPFKPAETGCVWDSQSKTLVPADARLLQRASGTTAPLDVICPFRFRTPVAPYVAAEIEGVPLTVERVKERVVECYSTLASSHDIVIVETAGGILVPLAYGFHYGDLARLLELPVLLVAGSKLGVLNHTLLTISYLKSCHLPLLGCVLNHCTPDTSLAIDTNAEALRKLGATPLFVLPNFAGTKIHQCGQEFEELASRVLEWLGARRQA
jgi:dethiobiotin synthetase